jgi:hypothetical protein
MFIIRTAICQRGPMRRCNTNTGRRYQQSSIHLPAYRLRDSRDPKSGDEISSFFWLIGLRLCCWFQGKLTPILWLSIIGQDTQNRHILYASRPSHCISVSAIAVAFGRRRFTGWPRPNGLPFHGKQTRARSSPPGPCSVVSAFGYFLPGACWRW